MPKIFKQPLLYLALGIIIYIAVFFYLSLFKYNNFLYNMEDLSIFTNTVHNTSLGQWFFFSSHGGYSYLGDHLELILLLIVPFYLFFKSALTLVFFQTFLIGLSAWPLYLIAQKILAQKPASLKNAPSLIIAFSFLLTLITREDASLTLGALSLIALWEHKKNLWPQKKWWLYPMLLSGGWFFLSLFFLGHFYPDSGFPYLFLFHIFFE